MTEPQVSGTPCECPPDACLCGFAETFNASQDRIRSERDRYREALLRIWVGDTGSAESVAQFAFQAVHPPEALDG